MGTIDKKLLSTTFLPYINTKADYNIWWGGGGSGKSRFVAQRMIYLALTLPYFRLIYCRKFAEHIRKSCFLELKTVLMDWADRDKTNEFRKLFTIYEGDMSIKFVNGNLMLAIGIDNPEKIKSISEPTHAWLEEVTELNQEDFEQVEIRLRSSRVDRVQIDMTMNPVSERNWTRTRLFPIQIPTNRCFELVRTQMVGDIEVKLKSFYHHSTAAENTFLNDEYKAKLMLKARYSENDYRVYWLGQWGVKKTGNEFYPKFKSNLIVQETAYRPEQRIETSWDFNVLPYVSALLCQFWYEGEKIIMSVFDEVAGMPPRNSPECATQDIITRYPSIQAATIYGDASGRNKQTLISRINNKIQRNNYEVIKEVFLTNKIPSTNNVPLANPYLEARKGFINAIFNEAYPIEIRISPKCGRLIEDLEQVQSDVDGGKLKKKVMDKDMGVSYEHLGHMSDAFDYIVCEVFKKYYKNHKVKRNGTV